MDNPGSLARNATMHFHSELSTWQIAARAPGGAGALEARHFTDHDSQRAHRLTASGRSPTQRSATGAELPLPAPRNRCRSRLGFGSRWNRPEGPGAGRE